MRIRILSDLHLEWCGLPIEPTDSDVTLLCGDIWTHTNGLEWAGELMAEKRFDNNRNRVIYLPGNHEYYNEDINELPSQLKEFARDNEIALLLNGTTEITFKEFPDYVILGGTLWTDFKWYFNSHMAMDAAKACLNDYQLINNSNELLTPKDTQRIHYETLKRFESSCERHKDKKIIIATHMAPSSRSSSPKYANDPITAAFCSNLDEWIKARPQIKLWCHGHMHNTSDYRIGECQVIANPRGYQRSLMTPAENRNFDPNLVIEI